ncbi:MAG: 2-C-methyl-D-erythritol 2,4-cyclodiphosphate synthase [SAR202 cluster bacterium]|nr:2-C-methyl-D-erythritol 2,4-cyclodiphosphate synthase [SAR202 cluster bacterium]
MAVRSGIGFDTHKLVRDRTLILGGITIPSDSGLDGHSDGDVLVHAIIDAMLGGAGLGDIGLHFPSQDPKYKNILSMRLLEKTVCKLSTNGWRATYLDATIIAQFPPLRPFIADMEKNVSERLGLECTEVNIKAKTTDGLGFTGRGDGIAAICVATLESI